MRKKVTDCTLRVSRDISRAGGRMRCIREHTLAYVSIRQHTDCTLRVSRYTLRAGGRMRCGMRCIRQHTSAYVRQHTSAYDALQNARVLEGSVEALFLLKLYEGPIKALFCVLGSSVKALLML